MSDWSWFNNVKVPEQKVDKYILPKPINYHKIAKDKTLTIENMRADPNLLFSVVDSESNCMCGGRCGSCEYEDLTFFDLVIRYKTLNEADFLDFDEIHHKLEWFKISQKVPLSKLTLVKFRDQVDWDAISSNYGLYKIDKEFIGLFHSKINWSLINKYNYNIKLDDIDPNIIVFKYKEIPIDASIRLEMLKKEHFEGNIMDTAPFCDLIIDVYGSKFLETLDDPHKHIDRYISKHSELFINSCIKYTYVPTKYPFLVSMCKPTTLEKFINACKPNDKYIEQHILLDGFDIISKNIWRAISADPNLSDEFIFKYSKKLDWNLLMKWKTFPGDVLMEHFDEVPSEIISRYQKLSPEFIDEHATKLDWYCLCEYQELPCDLMEKHVNRLNWGQVSLYQKMTLPFMKKYKNNLNEVKLLQNPKIEKILHFLQ
jgi:hypothetical protein